MPALYFNGKIPITEKRKLKPPLVDSVFLSPQRKIGLPFYLGLVLTTQKQTTL